MNSLKRLREIPFVGTKPGSDCVVCGGKQWTRVAAGYDYEYETCGNEWIYRACGSCGHVQIDSLPSDDALSKIYPPHYYSYLMEDVVHPIALRAKALLDRLKFKSIITQLKRTPGSYLDVGCGDGRYINFMISQGMKSDCASGTELDSRAVAAAVAKGLNVRQCKIEDADHLQLASLDLVTMFHVIEHVERPDDVVIKLRSLLSVGGMLAIETPNFASLDARLARRSFWGGYHIPRHWHLFTAKSMTELLERAGFKVISLRYKTGHAFWLWTLHHWLKYGHNMPKLAAFCHPLKNVPLLAVATVFDIVRSRLGAKTSAMLVLAERTE